MKKISDHFWSKNIPVPNRDFSEISMKTEGKSTREKVHLGSGQLSTNPRHTVVTGENTKIEQFLKGPPFEMPKFSACGGLC